MSAIRLTSFAGSEHRDEVVNEPQRQRFSNILTDTYSHQVLVYVVIEVYDVALSVIPHILRVGL